MCKVDAKHAPQATVAYALAHSRGEGRVWCAAR